MTRCNLTQESYVLLTWGALVTQPHISSHFPTEWGINVILREQTVRTPRSRPRALWGNLVTRSHSKPESLLFRHLPQAFALQGHMQTGWYFIPFDYACPHLSFLSPVRTFALKVSSLSLAWVDASIFTSAGFWFNNSHGSVLSPHLLVYQLQTQVSTHLHKYNSFRL